MTEPERIDLRGPAERRVRAAWRTGAAPGFGAAEVVFGLAVDLRHLAYDVGLLRPRRAPLPVLSVGGLTVGGSGKTPVAACAARWLGEAGRRAAVVTRGFRDELEVHRTVNPGVVVTGARERVRAVRAARDRGARVAVLDDGFQHLRMRRDLEWVAVDAAHVRRDGWRRLPAGPARDRWGELRRADAVILTSRGPGSASEPATGGRDANGDARIAAGIRRQFPGALVARCYLRSAGLRPANRAARDRRPEVDPAPAVAIASIMKGEEFLDALRRTCPGVVREYLFPDHGHVADAVLAELLEAAGTRGVVGTLKDVVKIRDRAGERTPVWYVGEAPEWREGEGRLRAQLEALVEAEDAATGD